MTDAFKYGMVMMLIAWAINIVMAMTYYKWLGITPFGLGIF
jgi:hypothetical protein